MKKAVLSAILFLTALGFVVAQTPALGPYPATFSMSACGNATVSPLMPPAGAQRIMAYTASSFKGLLRANPITGTVTITNAHPAGSYIISVKAFNGTSSNIAAFTLVVSNTNCSHPGAPVNLTTGASSYAVVINDFNNDGKQDVAVSNYTYTSTSTVVIRLGDGSGGFTGTSAVSVGSSPRAMVTADFNGDGNADLATMNQSSASVSVRLGDGAGSFTAAPDVPLSTNPNSMAVADFNADGLPDLAIAIYNSHKVSVRLGDGAGNFSGTTEVPVGVNPMGLTVSDFNGDGKPDFTTLTQGREVSVRLNNGSGGFVNAPDIILPGRANDVAAGDVNNDGKADMVFCVVAGYISVRLGDGLGNFSGTTDLLLGAMPKFIALGDFNGDGNLDFASTNVSISEGLTIRRGDGSGSFWGGTTFNEGSYPNNLCIGDFNSDGRQDIILTKDGSIGTAIHIGNSSTNEIGLYGNNTAIADGSTAADTANNTELGNNGGVAHTYKIKNTGSVNLSIHSITVSGPGAAAFSTGGITLPATIPAGDSVAFTIRFLPATVGLKTAVVTIFNDDCDEGIYDFAVQGTGVLPVLGNYSPAGIPTAGGNAMLSPSVLPANTMLANATTSADFKGLLNVDPVTGQLKITNAHPAGSYTITLKAFNGLLTTTTTFVLTVNNTACGLSVFSGPAAFQSGSAPVSIAVADFNGDGKQDLITANSGENSVVVRFGTGTGTFTGSTVINVNGLPKAIAVSDFNGDGKQDFAVSLTTVYDAAFIYVGNGAGGFTQSGYAIVTRNANQLLTGDFNGDGKPDLAAINRFYNTISIRLGDGGGSFISAPIVPGINGPQSAAIGDFNLDGNQDLAVVCSGFSGSVAVRLGDGAGSFSTAINITTGGSPLAVAIGDFNADGYQDMAVTDSSGNSVSVQLGEGTGYFTAAGNITVGSRPGAIATGDFNGDGKTDLITANLNSNTLSVLQGNGAGNFTAITSVATGVSPWALAIGDFNSDGKQDIATANRTDSTVAISLGISGEIQVQGNNTAVTNGDTIPAAANYTDFGSTTIGNNRTRIFTIQNTGAANLTISNIAITGIDSSLFTVSGIAFPSGIFPGASRNFTLTFSPTNAGVKKATVNISNDDCDEVMFDFAIAGASCPASDPPNVWLGITASWALASNWSLNFVPSACTNVLVNNGVPYMPEITNPNSSCYSLILNNGAVITVKTGGHLNITANH